MVKDLNPLATPNSVLTDALNATLITFNGNEFLLQNEMGNGVVERAKLSPGFLPLGMKEHGGIIYIASYNPETQECEIGSFPSPERDITGSDKIEYQSGLRDANFLTEEFALSTSHTPNFEPTEQIVNLKKLNQSEVLQLNPGDKFVVSLKINEVTTSEEDQLEIEDLSNFYNIFNINGTDKKTFTISFYKIDDANNIKPLNKPVSLVNDSNYIDEDLYQYYTENSKGSIAVGVELNQIENFDVSIRETSKRIDSNKNIRIEAVADNVSDVLFKGVLVDIDRNDENIKFHIQKENDSIRKISMDVNELNAEDELYIKVTPYTQYGYLPKLKKEFKFEVSKKIGGDNINDVFRWRVLDDYIEIDFDFKYETDNLLDLYLEFYDLWSNYSLIVPYNSPSIYTPMRLSIPLVNEPTTDIFDNNQLGGTLRSKLTENLNVIEKSFLTNPSKTENKHLIRRDLMLRKNHIYLVRICGVERIVEDNEVIETIYNDVYKLIYTTEAYNNIYNSQLDISFSDPDFIKDFNLISYPLEEISFDATITSGSASTVKVAGSIPNDIPRTNGELFKINEVPIGTTLEVKDDYTVNQSHSLNVTLANKNLIIGQLTEGILKLETPNNVIVFDQSNISEDYSDISFQTDSAGTITIPNIEDEGVYIIDVNATSSRKVKGDFFFEDLETPVLTQDTLLGDLLYSNTTKSRICSQCGESGDPSCIDAEFSLYRVKSNDTRPCTWIDSDRSLLLRLVNHVTNQTYLLSFGDNEFNAMNSDDNAFSSGDLINYQFFVSAVGSYMKGMTKTTQLIFIARSASDPNFKRIVVFASKSNKNGISNPSLIKGVLNNLALFKIDNTIKNNYYMNETTIKFHENVTTTFKNLNVSLISKFDVAQKTYVFNIRFYGLNDVYNNLTTSLINDYISNLNTGNNNILSVIPDSGVIPFATPSSNFEKTFNFKLPDIILSKGVDTSLLNLFINSKSNYLLELNKLQNDAVNYNPSEAVKSLTTNPSLIEFAKIFRWDELNNELAINEDVIQTEITYAESRTTANATSLRCYDKIISPAFPL